VSVVRRFGRPHFKIVNEWKQFTTPLKRRTDIDWGSLKAGGDNNFGMRLEKRAKTKR